MGDTATQRGVLEGLFKEHGFEDFRWIPASGIRVAQWVRMKCQFGCPEYGTNVACPPNNPPVAECERFIGEYTEAALFHFVKTAPDHEERRRWSRETSARLLEVERAVFLAGHPKAFMLLVGSCPHCEECVGRPGECRLPGSARPTPEGLAIDLFTTATSAGYPLAVLENPLQPMNRYAILLVD